MDGTSCGSCGASNPAGAPFCWQCYTPIAAPLPAGVGPAGGAPAGMPGRPGAAPGPSPRLPMQPAPAPVAAPTNPRGSRPFLWLGALVVLAVGGWLIYINLVRGTPELPQQVGGLTRMTVLEEQPMMQQAQEQMRSQWTPNSSFGIYGEPGGTVPVYVAIVATGINPTLEEHIDSLSIIGAPTTDLDRFEVSTVGEIEIGCGRLQAQIQAIGTACVAKDGLNVAAVVAQDAEVEAAQAFTIELMQGVG